MLEARNESHAQNAFTRSTTIPEAQLEKERRANQARINGAKSHGPTTPEGKAKPSRNSLKHGFAAQINNILLDHEDSDGWRAHVAGYHDSYRPTNYAECEMVDQIASIRWRQARLITIETAHIAFRIGIQEDKVRQYHPLEKDNSNLHLVLAWQGLARKPFPRPLHEDPSVAPDPTQPPDGLDIDSIELVRRYETTLDRQFRKVLLSLRQYRRDFTQLAEQNEPTIGGRLPSPLPTPKPAICAYPKT